MNLERNGSKVVKGGESFEEELKFKLVLERERVEKCSAHQTRQVLEKLKREVESREGRASVMR